jgi:hypothetical protein
MAEGQKQQAPRTQWEYRVDVLGAHQQFDGATLNRVGEDGWELVYVQPAKSASEPTSLVFKRRKQG